MPGKRPRWVTGGILELRARGSPAVHAEARAAFGRVWKSWGGSRPFIFVADPAVSRSILLRNRERPKFASFWSGRDAEFEAASILAARGAFHHALRNTVWVPLFFRSSLDRFRPLVAAHVSALAASLDAAAGTVVDVHESFKVLTLDVVGEVAFGLSLNAGRGGAGADLKEGLDAIFRVNGLSFSRYGAALLFFPVAQPLIRWAASRWPDAGMARVRGNRERVLKTVMPLIAAHREAVAAEAAAAAAAGTPTPPPTIGTRALRSGVAPGSFLDLCVRATDKATGAPLLSPRAVANQALVMLAAGMETTANALAYVLFCLHKGGSEGPLAWVREEVDAKVKAAGGAAAAAAASATDAEAWPRLDAAWREALRLFPPAPMLVRELERETDALGVAVAKGAWVAVPALVQHRDPEIWGGDAMEYRPARWIDGSVSDEARASFLIWGAGSRQCVGRALALLEAKTALAVLLARFDFELAPGQDPLLLRQTITLSPAEGLKATPRLRSAPGKGRPATAREA